MKKKLILVIELEPAPYKTDLWNAFIDSGSVDLKVVFTESKNWAPDGGHDFKRWPESRFNTITSRGKGFLGILNATRTVLSEIFFNKTNLIYIAGYDRFVTFSAILVAIILKRSFVVHGDQYNNEMPSGNLKLLKFFIREAIRKIIFKKSKSILICGRQGTETVISAGCPASKIIDFPYVINVERMLSESPKEIPIECKLDIEAKKNIIIFSGRMIKRKGLQTLLKALSSIGKNWVLWVEGDGVNLKQYKDMSTDLNIDHKCRFLGFCQYDTHAWLMRNSDIVVVPSLEDPWGIVVDEGLQLQKLVISSDATGSGYDRINHTINGYIFPAGNSTILASTLENFVKEGVYKKDFIKNISFLDSKNIKPNDNVRKLLALI